MFYGATPFIWLRVIGKTIYYAAFHGKWKDLRAVPVLKRQGLTKITDLMCHMGVHPHAHTLAASFLWHPRWPCWTRRSGFWRVVYSGTGTTVKYLDCWNIGIVGTSLLRGFSTGLWGLWRRFLFHRFCCSCKITKSNSLVKLDIDIEASVSRVAEDSVNVTDHLINCYGLTRWIYAH